MSLPFFSFNCTSCNLDRHFYFDTAYQFENTNHDGYVPSLETAWCEDCDTVVTSMYPQTEASIASEVDLRTKWIAEELEKRRSLFHPFTNPNETLIQKWKSEIAHLKMSVEFFRYKRTVPRCLTCGGGRIVPLELPNSDAKSHFLGIKHHCGGEVYGSSKGKVSFMSLPVVKFNIEGTIISDERLASAAEEIDRSGLDAITGLAGNVSLELLKAAQLPEIVENIVHPEFSILGVYLSVREFLAINESVDNAVAISQHVLTSPPYLNKNLTTDAEDFANLRGVILDALLKYDREANCYFGTGPAPWSHSKESQKFGRKAFQIFFERLSSYLELESQPICLSIGNLENEISKQTEVLSNSFYELRKSEVI